MWPIACGVCFFLPASFDVPEESEAPLKIDCYIQISLQKGGRMRKASSTVFHHKETLRKSNFDRLLAAALSGAGKAASPA